MKVLPESMLSKMSRADRRSIGQLSASEAKAKYESGQEKELQKQIRNLLLLRRVYFFQSPINKRAQGKPGRADFVCCYRGRWLSIEAKAETGKQSQEQIDDMINVRKSGGVYIVARCLQDVLDALREIDRVI